MREERTQPHVEEHDPDPRRALWRAVITQALMDAKSRSMKPEKVQDRKEALEWLYAESAEVMEDFEEVCALAGYNAGWVSTKCREARARGYFWRNAAPQPVAFRPVRPRGRPRKEAVERSTPLERIFFTPWVQLELGLHGGASEEAAMRKKIRRRPSTLASFFPQGWVQLDLGA